MILASDTPEHSGSEKKNALNGYHCTDFGRTLDEL